MIGLERRRPARRARGRGDLVDRDCAGLEVGMEMKRETKNS